MRTQNFVKTVLSVLVIGACCASAVALGTQAISKGNIRQAIAKIAKMGAADVKSIQRVTVD